ncbi:hypothetical protein ACF082_26715 [Streptomyces lydicus]|nr:hypothetical protein [Streptomyces lydicus]
MGTTRELRGPAGARPASGVRPVRLRLRGSATGPFMVTRPAVARIG